MIRLAFRRPTSDAALSTSSPEPLQLFMPTSLNLTQQTQLLSLIGRLGNLPSSQINVALAVGDTVLRTMGV